MWRLQDKPDPLHQSGSGDDLARQVNNAEAWVKLKILVAGMIVAAGFAGSAVADEEPKSGGTLTYMIPADAPPSFDAHREETYATIHSAAPFYSVLIRANPYDPGKTDDLVCDLCTAMPKPTDDGKTYTFKIREGSNSPTALH
jgi:peptide/nickel transport system substrate-binding protein